MKTFKGGIHPEYCKDLARDKSVKTLTPPAELIIPLIQHTGKPCQPTVKTGDHVKIGTVIGSSDKLISALVHSSVSGAVKSIKKTDHPTLGQATSIVVANDGKDEKEEFRPLAAADIKSLSPDDIIAKIRECGIVGLGGAGFPTHVKLMPPKDKLVDTFILNGSECEPYLTCDERVMMEHPNEVLQGVLIMMAALKVKNGVIAIEDNKPLAIKAMRAAADAVRSTQYAVRIAILRTKYPQGGEKQLIEAVLDRRVPPAGLPFDVGCVVDNVQTAYAVYEAILKGKPMYEKVITVTGDAINNPSNLLVRIGTPAIYVIENCGGFSAKAGKIIIGGPMMGISQYAPDVPIIKGTSGILVLSLAASQIRRTDYCIRCGRCVQSCPMNLMPTELAKSAEYNHFDMANNMHVQDCIECGCCAYVCPSNIPLVQLIKHAKRSILCQI